MADFFADEHVPPQLAQWLSRLGHNCPAVRQYNEDKRGDGWSDEEVLRFASVRGWIVITFNAKHFLGLAETCKWHHGIVIAEAEADKHAQARRIDDLVRDAIRQHGTLRGRVIEARLMGPLPKPRQRQHRRPSQ